MAKHKKTTAEKMQERLVGRGCVPLMYFDINDESAGNGGKLVDPSNIQRLINIFELEGCNTAEWPVCVNLSQEQYRQITQCPETNQQSLNDQSWPLPSADFLLTCIQGRHRIAAGRRFLPSDRYWWHAYLYLDGKQSPSFVPSKTDRKRQYRSTSRSSR